MKKDRVSDIRRDMDHEIAATVRFEEDPIYAEFGRVVVRKPHKLPPIDLSSLGHYKRSEKSVRKAEAIHRATGVWVE